MTPRSLLPVAVAAAALLLPGCLGYPEGAADTGDLVSVRYTAEDLATGEVLRENDTASFDVGSGASGLGLRFERALRGRVAGETFDVVVRDDPSLAYGERVEVNRTLQPIAVEQVAPRDDFVSFVGEPTVGLTFPAYGIYTGRVTAATNDTVEFRVEAEDGQEDPVPSVGAVLVTHVGPTSLVRELRPVEGATFTVNPPSPFQPNTPLGLEPGAYQVVGATEDKLLLARSASAEADLIGKDLRLTVTVVAITQKDEPIPTGNYGVRGQTPVLQRDPSAVLGQPLPRGEAPAGGHDAGHGH